VLPDVQTKLWREVRRERDGRFGGRLLVEWFGGRHCVGLCRLKVFASSLHDGKIGSDHLLGYSDQRGFSCANYCAEVFGGCNGCCEMSRKVLKKGCRTQIFLNHQVNQIIWNAKVNFNFSNLDVE
jgi:hypothetical protein